MARILIVDDDPDILNLLSKILSVQGHTVFRAADAMKAMDHLNSSVFDLVISDANMPKFSGFELVRTIRNNKKFQKMAVAMLTSLREKKDIEKGIRAGVDDYIIKPIDPSLLLDKVSSLFEKKPPKIPTVYTFPDEPKLTEAEATFHCNIISIDDHGLVFSSPFPITEGTVLRLQFPLFEKLQMNPPSLEVSSVDAQPKGFEVKAHFKRLREVDHRKLRNWLQLQLQKGKAA